MKRRPPTSALFPAIWMFGFLIAPILLVFCYSFLKRGEYGGVVWEFSLENYLRAFDPLYLGILVKSLTFAFLSTAACLFFGYPVAYLIVRSTPIWRAILLFLISVPFITNFVVRAFALKGMLAIEGPINHLLVHWGWFSEPVSFLNRPEAILFGMVTNYVPFMIFPLYVALDKVEVSYIEAARDLGASALKSFIKVLIPLTMRGILTGCLLVFIPALGEFVIPEVFGGGRTMFIGSLITDQFLKARDWPFGSALSMILFMTMGLGSLIQRRMTKTRLYAQQEL